MLQEILEDSTSAPQPLDPEMLRQHGKAMIDRVADYWATIRERRPMPDVQPGDIRKKLPQEPPENAESFDAIFGDLEEIVFKGTTNWHHPQFYAYFPTACSYPAICADILSDGLACVGFTWASSPACTEVEMVMMDWLAKALALPEHFLFSHPGSGGGIIQCTASDSSLVALLAARSRTIRLQQELQEQQEEQTATAEVPAENMYQVSRLFSSVTTKAWKTLRTLKTSLETVYESITKSSVQQRLVAYCSDQSHSSVERAGLLAAVTIRALEPDDNYSLRGSTLEFAIQEDLAKGLIPFAVIATLGTTPSCAFDNLRELGTVCQKHKLWLHVDAAYAGSAFICPEYRYLMDGVEMVESFNFNPHKFMLINFDCSAMWFRDTLEVEQAFHVDPLYLKHAAQGLVPDYRHWQIPLGRRFRSLKIWFVLRAFGISGLRAYIRKCCALAKEFEQLVMGDDRFEITVPVALGLVCFRLTKQPNSTNEHLLKLLNDDGRIHLVPSTIRGTYILRLAICSSLTTFEDLQEAWQIIRQFAEVAIEEAKKNGTAK